MNGRLIEKPAPTFGQAVSMAFNNLTNFGGRSRRSEFWWFMLVFWIGMKVVGMILSMLLPMMAATLVEEALWFFALAVAVRRLQDTGKSRWWVVVSWVSEIVVNVYSQTVIDFDALMLNPTPDALVAAFTNPVIIVSLLVGAITGIATLVFCLLDSTPGANKYGESPKYAVAGDDTASSVDEATTVG